MEPLILDASVLIGLLDTEDSHHDRAVDEIDQADRDNHELLTPATAYSEAPIAERAAELRAQHDALRLPDALVLATAQAHRGSLVTYDRRLARAARRVA